jgi:hypothetical protein
MPKKSNLRLDEINVCGQNVFVGNGSLIMYRLLIMLIWVGGLAGAAGAGDETNVPPARLANGLPVEGVFQKTNAAGLVFQTPKGVQTNYPWKYLSAGTRYRYLRTLQLAPAPPPPPPPPVPVPPPVTRPATNPPVKPPRKRRWFAAGAELQKAGS